MPKKLKIKNFILTIPDDDSNQTNFKNDVQPVYHSENSEIIEPAEQEYIYKPYDPGQSPVDRARATTNINNHDKSWVKKAWFIIFVIGPLAALGFIAFIMILSNEPLSGIIILLSVLSIIVFPFWLIHYLIWRRNIKSSSKK